jgi:hypothetical protein
MKVYIFVSYSREDETYITQIVKLLRTAIAGVPSVEGNQWEFVYQDTDHLTPGSDWENDINKAIALAERMFVFWCEHSAISEQVRREYKFAQDLEKTVIPVLIDGTALPADLSRIHGVDLRALKMHGPQFRYMFPPPGWRSPEQIITEEFADVLGIDPRVMQINIWKNELGRY